MLRERDAAVADRLVETFDGVEAAVGERLVEEDPQMLGRLRFGTVAGWTTRWMPWAREGSGLLPTGPIALQHDGFSGSGAHRLGKIGQNEFKRLFAGHVGDVPHCLPGWHETRSAAPATGSLATLRPSALLEAWNGIDSFRNDRTNPFSRWSWPNR